MRIFTLISTFFISINAICQQPSSHTVYFDFDIDIPSAKEKQQLVSFIEKFRSFEIKSVSVEGHTDVKGSSEYNQDLSQDRAKNVMQIIKSLTSPSIPVTLSYYGKEKPLTLIDEKQPVNRRVTVTITYLEKIEPPTEINAFTTDVVTQRFDINLDDTVLIKGKDGTIIKIDPGSIQDKKNKLASGPAVLLLKEYYKPVDILFSGLQTISRSGVLQTSGMFYLTIVVNNDTMSSVTKKPVDIKMPVMTNTSGNMNVYAMNENTDSSMWNNTGKPFNRVEHYWDWPKPTGKLYDVPAPTFKYENWRIGYKYSEDFPISRGSLVPFKNNNASKMVRMKIEKLDSLTLKVDVNVRYRNRGMKLYDTRNFDTSLLVKYKRGEYSGVTYNIGWINCDKFLNLRNPVEYTIRTPKFNGARVVLYFKSQNAYLSATENKKGSFTTGALPAGEKVWILAYGQDQGFYYLAKKEAIVDKNNFPSLELEKVTAQDFKKTIAGLSF